MKNKLFTLFKIISIDNYKLNGFKKSNKGLKEISKSLLTLFILIVILGYSALYSYIGYDALQKYGMQSYIVIAFYIIASISVFMTSTYKAKPIIFDSKDNEMLFSMPIKSSTIFFSRVLNLLSINYLLSAFIFIPCVLIYCILEKLTVIYYLNSLIIFIFIPFIPTIVASIIGYFIAILSSKTRNKKFFETIFNIAFVLLIMYISNKAPQIFSKLVENSSSIDKFMNTYGYVITLVKRSIIESNMISTLIFVSINIVLMYLSVQIFSSKFKNIVNKLKEVSTKKSNKKRLEYNVNNITTALLKKEFKRYFNVPVYLLNTAFGVIMLLFLTIANVFFKNDMINQIMSGEGLNTSLSIMVLILTSFIVAMSNTTCSSISLEGKSMWVLRTLPIKVKQIFNAKIIVNILVVLPITIFCIIALGIKLNISAIDIIPNIILVSILNIAISQFGLLVNLKFPKMDYISETQVVKQSMSSFIAIFAPMILVFGVMIFYQYIASKYFNVKEYTIIVTALIAVIVTIQNKILNTWGKNTFLKL